jgi:hypothetical protein
MEKGKTVVITGKAYLKTRTGKLKKLFREGTTDHLNESDVIDVTGKFYTPEMYLDAAIEVEA